MAVGRANDPVLLRRQFEVEQFGEVGRDLDLDLGRCFVPGGPMERVRC